MTCRRFVPGVAAARCFLLLEVLGTLACYRHPFAAATANLVSRDPEVRKAAADDLRDAGPVPLAIPHLIEAANREQHPEPYGAIMIALGASGISKARAFIEPCLVAKNARMRRWAEHALELWLVRNGVLKEGAGLPDLHAPVYHWPENLRLPPGAPGGRNAAPTSDPTSVVAPTERPPCVPGGTASPERAPSPMPSAPFAVLDPSAAEPTSPRPASQPGTPKIVVGSVLVTLGTGAAIAFAAAAATCSGGGLWIHCSGAYGASSVASGAHALAGLPVLIAGLVQRARGTGTTSPGAVPRVSVGLGAMAAEWRF